MRFIGLTAFTILALEAASVLSAPIAHDGSDFHSAGNANGNGVAGAGQNQRARGNGNGRANRLLNGAGGRNRGGRGGNGNNNNPVVVAPPAAGNGTVQVPPAAGNETVAAPPAEGGAGGEEEGGENDIVREGTFGTPVTLQGGNVKQDTEYKAESGKFEIEFAAATGTDLTVVSQKAVGQAPAGFSFLDSNSFKVSTSTDVTDFTVLKIDYIFDNAAPLVVAAGAGLKDSVIGKRCGLTGNFVVDGLGEVEFEVEENETVLKVKDIVGEYAVFIPTASLGGAAPPVAAPPAAAPPAAAPPVAAPPAAGNGTVEAPPAGGETGGEEEKKDEILINGTFNTPLQFPGGNKKADILFPASEAGAFEVEHNGVSPVTITVKAQTPSAAPPAGHLFVDASSFVVTSNAGADATLQKIDYIFSEAVLATIDASKGLIGKLDAATGQFVVANLGEFEFEQEENEWTLTVNDLNGEWAVLVPTSAVKP